MPIYEKTYDYKVYRNGEFLGLLPGVISPFTTNQRINTVAVELPITVQTQFDTSELQPPYLETEDGEILETEDGEPFTLERYPDVIGPQDTEALIRNNNDLVVIEYSEDNPNGVQVFEGYISRWKAKYGAGSDIIEISALSYGVELDNYVAKSGSTLQISQETETGQRNISESDGYELYGQNIDPGTYSISQIDVLMVVTVNPTIVTVKLYQGVLNDSETSETGDGVLLGTVIRSLAKNGDSSLDPNEWFPFVFDDPIAVSSGSDYYFTVETTRDTGSGGLGPVWIAEAGDVYAGGEGGYFFNYTPPFGSPRWSMGGTDLAFRVYAATGNTTAEYEDTDPSDMLRDALDSYIGQGGNVNYDDNSIEDTPYLVDYTFKVATILEVAEKAKELAPGDWYYYVDPADSKFYFKAPSTTPDHTFVKGVHLSDLEIEASVEEIKNLVLFSGGDTGGGVNLFNQYSNQDSIDLTGRQKLERMSDNRVTVNATADRLAESFLEENGDEIFRSAIFLAASVYDITTVNVGDVVRITGLGNWVDEELIQITELKRTPDGLFLTLGKLPLRAKSYIDEIKRDLAKQQTIDNPDAPS